MNYQAGTRWDIPAQAVKIERPYALAAALPSRSQPCCRARCVAHVRSSAHVQHLIHTDIVPRWCSSARRCWRVRFAYFRTLALFASLAIIWASISGRCSKHRSKAFRSTCSSSCRSWRRFLMWRRCSIRSAQHAARLGYVFWRCRSPASSVSSCTRTASALSTVRAHLRRAPRDQQAGGELMWVGGSAIMFAASCSSRSSTPATKAASPPRPIRGARTAYFFLRTSFWPDFFAVFLRAPVFFRPRSGRFDAAAPLRSLADAFDDATDLGSAFRCRVRRLEAFFASDFAADVASWPSFLRR